MKTILILCAILLLGLGCSQDNVLITSVEQSKSQTYTIVVPGTNYKWTNISNWESSGYGTEIVFTDMNGNKIKSNCFLIIEE